MGVGLAGGWVGCLEEDMVSGERNDGRENCSDSFCTRVLEDNGLLAGHLRHWDRHQEERRVVVGTEIEIEAGTGTGTGTVTWVRKGSRGCEGYMNGTGRAGCCGWEAATEYGLIRGS